MWASFTMIGGTYHILSTMVLTVDKTKHTGQGITLSLHQVSQISGRPTSVQIYLGTQIQTKPSSTPEFHQQRLNNTDYTWDTFTLPWPSWDHLQVSGNVLQIFLQSNPDQSVECLGDVPIRLTITAGRGEVGGAQQDSIARSCMPLCVSPRTPSSAQWRNEWLSLLSAVSQSHANMPSFPHSWCMQTIFLWPLWISWSFFFLPQYEDVI